MNDFERIKKSLDFKKNEYRHYYRNNEVMLPDRFGRREYAFVLFGSKGMIRHIGFEKKSQLLDFLIDRAPSDVYYSSAYYQRPDAQTMNEKNWMGAELIFDLDSDHLPNVEDLSYERQLELVKREFHKLVSDFLLNDFGFDERYLELYFSGGRGYHCHVKDPKIFGLDSGERREIVDYITGRDLKESLIFHEQIKDTKDYGHRRFASVKSLKMPMPDDPGWRGRISRGVIDIVNDILNSDDSLQRLEEYGVKRSEAEKLLKDLSDERVQRIKAGNLDQSKTIRKFFLNNALRKTAVSMSAGETDEPVTCDVKRLIRLPGSLHGKTGFKVKKLTLDTLSDFDPLVDTIVFSDEEVKVLLNKPFSISIKNDRFKLEAGVQKVPKYLAVFLIGRKLAFISD